MVKQELTKDALAKLENLRRQFADFQEDCSKLLKSIQNDDFLDSETAAGVQSSLANITTIQKQLGLIYQDLALGALPKKLTEAAENISNAFIIKYDRTEHILFRLNAARHCSDNFVCHL